MSKKILLVATCALALSVTVSAPSALSQLAVSDFSGSALKGWQEKSFKGITVYKLRTGDERTILEAESKNSASGLFKEVDVDLEKYPYLNWSWRVDQPLDTGNERVKSGDDFAARVYVVIDGGIFFWKTRALNYVWANKADKSEQWPNPFAGKNVMMMAIRNRDDNTTEWYNEKRNIAEDLKRAFGKSFNKIDAVAVMTDTDNSEGYAKAQYGEIFFSAH
jgi:hypothetical protein